MSSSNIFPRTVQGEIFEFVDTPTKTTLCALPHRVTFRVNCSGFLFCLQVLNVDSSSSIASPYYPNPALWRYTTSFYRPSNPTCSWQVVTKDTDYLELTFDDVSISSSYRQGCSCGRIEVHEGYQNRRHLGTFCQAEGEALKVSSRDNSMFVAYYACERSDKFKATIRARNVGAYWSLHLLWGLIPSLPN